ncbi:MAG: hypothetical protein GKR97_05450 [Rhizobiaceae bacterium]|nr:hypothetical protein [Rhizobiaceae bacterium]
MSEQRVGMLSAEQSEGDPTLDRGKSATASDLHAKLVVIFGQQLDRFESEGGAGDVEQAAKALAILAKTLESIAAVSVKLGCGVEEKYNHGSGGTNEILSRSNSGGSQELDRQLIQLVKDLAEAGESSASDEAVT